MTTSRVIEAKGFYSDFPRKGGASPQATHYCAGCGHGVLHKLIAEALVDFALQDRAIMISPVGCAVFGYYYIDCGNVQAAHGRAPAVGAGIKRSTPNAVVIAYQGDGDLASIGLGQTLQAANRGERIAVFFVNNGVYGMTGGQMAPTTLPGQKTVTSPDGRDPATDGFPIHMCELINQFEAPVYIERCSLSTAKQVRRARAAVRNALQIQKEGKGYAFVEFLSPCPTNMKRNPLETAAFLDHEMVAEFPLGCLRDRSREAVSHPSAERIFDKDRLDALFADVAFPDVPARVGLPPLRIKVAGFGGQGVLSLGIMLAQAGQAGGRKVTWFPSYGPEQRGGTANCSVVMADENIGSPYVATMDLLVAMNEPSMSRFASQVVPGGTILYEASAGSFSAPDTVRVVPVPAFDMAVACGDERSANTAMLGVAAALGATGLAMEHFEGVLERVFARKKKVLDVNLRTFRHALKWANEQLA